MHSLSRLVGYSLLLLLLFIAAALGAQRWLHRQTQRLQAEAVEARRAQFETALGALPRAYDQWDAGYCRQLGALVGGTVVVYGEPPPSPPADPSQLYFDQLITASTRVPLHARVTFAIPPTSRMLASHQSVTVGLLLLGLVLLGAGAFFTVLNWQTPHYERSPSLPPETRRAEISSLERLVQSSVEQGAALDHERDGRRLAEQDALLKQQLLNQSLEGKIRLGHDLHDGIIQSLYASGLTIESARSVAQSDPAEADRRLAQCVENLNVTIRNVRAYITGLSPDTLRQAGFSRAIESHVNELRAGRPLRLDLKIDDDAAATLTPEQSTEVLQVAREALSNGLRHGGASAVRVRLHQSDREVCLLVQDDGVGFDPSRRTGSGHGLGNMQTRARRIGATVRIESQPGAGTRVILTLPLSPTS